MSDIALPEPTPEAEVLGEDPALASSADAEIELGVVDDEPAEVEVP